LTLGGTHTTRNHSRANSWGARVVSALSSGSNIRRDFRYDSKGSTHGDDRVWYDQFTSTDWVHDNIADAYRMKALRARKDFRGRLIAFFDGSQGWILSALVGCVTAVIAFWVNVSEAPIFDFKEGYCSIAWYMSEKSCCPTGDRCDAWRTWSEVVKVPDVGKHWIDFLFYICLMILLAAMSCLLTLTTKTVVPSTYRISTLDENLAAINRQSAGGLSDSEEPDPNSSELTPAMIYYSASGSGVAEVKVILSGFVLHGFLGLKTLTIKTLALVLSVASGLSLGKEGPFVHIAACVGNIACRLFSKYNNNDGKRREVLSAAAASGVAVAFGAPLGGVLFSLEEASYFFPAKTLFRTFFCCITAALTLKFLNPYGTKKIVLFEVRYLKDWEFIEMIPFVALGIFGGVVGALFIKASRFWALSFRRIPFVKRWPLLEVMLVALITGLISYWNKYTRLPVAKLLFNLASPCDDEKPDEMGLCPSNISEIEEVIKGLAVGFVIKGILTIITFGIKVPAGIYVPSMVVGGLMGRIVGHGVQYLVLKYPNTSMFGDCANHESGASCVTPGIYALIAGGSVMCGVTRLSVTIPVILFELTGSLDYVLPFSASILVAKWTADALEPLSIYDLLTNMNSYPFLNNKTKPVFTSDLADIMPRLRRERLIDISLSPLVPAISLREKLSMLHAAGEVDGGLPIIRDHALVGLIPAPDLEFALDSLTDEEASSCLMTTVRSLDENEDDMPVDPTDFTPYIDPVS
jgi:chloride channel 3/4/5